MATLANLVKNIDPPVEITQEEYNNLTEEQKNDGTVYYIVDGSSSFQTAATTPAEASDGTGSNVQAELDKRLEVSKLVNGGTATEAGYALDARYGKTLTDQINNLDSNLITINNVSSNNTAVTINSGGFIAIGKIVIFSVNVTLSSNVATSNMLISSLPNPLINDIPFIVQKENDFSTYYSCRLYGSNIYANTALVSGTYNINGAYVRR